MNSVVIFIVIVLVIILALAALLSSAGNKESAAWKQELRNKMANLSRNVDSNDKLVLYHSLVEADKLLDHALKHSKVSGSTMGERLKEAKRLFDYNLYNDIWDAHRVRNSLVHEVNFHVTNKQLKAHFLVLSSAISKLTK